jgi:hypothetical protein
MSFGNTRRMPRVSLRMIWPSLMLPAVLFVILAVAALGGGDVRSSCSGHDGAWTTPIAGQCARLVPAR